MKNSRYLILVFCGLLLFSCTGNKYIVERTPKHNNPVDEISVSYTHLTLPTICSV